MSVSQINYRETYFQYTTLTKIRGDPTYLSLSELERECRANGTSVQTTLGGGTQGHLGLTCSAPAYERVAPGTPFIRPVLPVLQQTANATGFQIEAARTVYDDELKVFHVCNLVERLIIQQISTAIDKECLTNFVDTYTGMLIGTIPEIFQKLFATYGHITPQTLIEARLKLETTAYEHVRPMATLLTSIDEYAIMADAAGAKTSSDQLIHLGLAILTRATMYGGDIRKWHDKPDANKTWPEFKTHFTDAQFAIKRSQPLITTDSLGYHNQVNSVSVVDQVLAQLTAQRDAEESIANEAAAEQLAAEQMQTQLAGMANSSAQNQTMMDQMQAMMSTISTLQAQANNGGRGGGGRGRGRGRGRGGRGGGRGNGRFIPKYCHTHGNCGHTGIECETKAEGHIDTATYANMQGGSTKGCHWL